VAIDSYCHNLVCIATKDFVAIDPDSCSGLGYMFIADGSAPSMEVTVRGKEVVVY
jgi:hypothetical protein